MIANHIHDALGQVRQLRRLILEKRCFHGYSGGARIGAGCIALATAVFLSSKIVPVDPLVHLAGWGMVLVAGLLLNYGALAIWFLSDREARLNPLLLVPAIDAVPALAVGAVLSAVVIRAESYDLLFGIWMSLYGLAQVAYRHSLPPTIYRVGGLYILAGFACLIFPVQFTNPWPMGLVFFIGEMAGGMALMKVRNGYDNEYQ